MRVVVYIDERDVPYADPGDRVDLTIFALGKKVQGQKIARLGSVIDKSSSMRVEIDVANQDNLLRAGMNGRATIFLAKATKEGMNLPLSCLYFGPTRTGVNLGGSIGGPRVYVIRGGKAHLTEIQTGYSRDDRTEVLSGLTTDDVVVSFPGDAKLQGAVVPVRVSK